MQFVLIARDKAGHLETRKANRDAHLAYVAETGVVDFGGPLFDDNGEMCGSLLVFSLPDADAVKAWASNDPYAKAGLFASVEINAWRKVL